MIPAIDLRGGRCVRLRQGDYDQETVFGDDPAAMAAHWEAEGATRIHLVDLDGAKAGRPVNVEAVRAILGAVNVPCQLGGGVRDEATIAAWLDAGIERVIVGTQALKDPAWFRAMAEKYPGRLVLGLDARDGRVATAGWLDVSSVEADGPGRAVRRPAARRGRLHRHRVRRDARGAEPGRDRGPRAAAEDPGDRFGGGQHVWRTWHAWRPCRSRPASSGAPFMTVVSGSARPGNGPATAPRHPRRVLVDVRPSPALDLGAKVRRSQQASTSAHLIEGETRRP